MISFSDDVRSSLDLLDQVIGEFDDGLTSSAESEHAFRNGAARAAGANLKKKSTTNGDAGDVDEPIRAQVRRVPGPPPAPTLPGKSRDRSAPPGAGKSGGAGGNRMVLNNHIDDIFSELTNEIYVEDKVRATAIAKIGQWKDRNDMAMAGPTVAASPGSSGASSSNVRHVNDPLPTPPPNTKISKE